MDYTDNDARRLLQELAKYAEAFAVDHSDSELTVKQLADDLADSSDDPNGTLSDLRYRVYDGLNNEDDGLNNEVQSV